MADTTSDQNYKIMTTKTLKSQNRVGTSHHPLVGTSHHPRIDKEGEDLHPANQKS